jgi:protein-tyrosine phosphatase
MSRLHWIPISVTGRLAIMARPRADEWLEIEIDAWKSAGVDRVISLLEPDEVSELCLQAEARLCRERGVGFLSFPIPDRGLPDRMDTRMMVDSVAHDLTVGRSVAIHCRAGIGRSSLIAACVQVCLGVEALQALSLIREARGVSVPDTEEQREWIMAFGRTFKN